MKSKDLPFLFLVAVVMLLIFNAWFFNFSILTYGDWYNQNTEALKNFFNLPFVWAGGGLGFIDLGLLFYPFNLFSGLLSRLGFGYGVIERVVFMWPLVIFSAFGSYFLVKKITKSHLGGLIGSLAFSYNTYFMSGRTGHLTLMAAFAIAPVVLLSFIKTLEEKKLSWAILTGLTAFMASFYEVRAFYIIAWVLFFYFLHYLFFQVRSSWKKRLVIVFFAAVPMLIVGALNLYWILGFLKVGTLTSNEIFSRGLFGNQYLNLSYAITLFHPFWGSPRGVYFAIQPIVSYFWLIPVFAFLGLLLKRKDKEVLFFGFIALLGILLTKQSAPPFTALYLWLYKHLPGFNAFREASKFYFLIALGYSVLIGAFVAWLWENGRSQFQRYRALFLTLLIAALFLWNGKNFITGKVGALFTPRHTPQDYLILNDFILRQNTYFRTLWVPTDSRWSFADNQNPRISALYLVEKWKKQLGLQSKNNLTAGGQVLEIFRKPGLDNLIDRASVKYVVVPLQDVENEDNFFVNYGESREFYVDELHRLNYLTRINVGQEKLAIFENKNYYPHIYLTKKNKVESGDNLWQAVDFETENPTEYKVHLRDVSKVVFLDFSENFDPNWQLKAGDFKWWQVITQKNYFLPDKNHLKSGAGLNSFLIDSVAIKKADPNRYTYIENPDGSIDIDLTLFFKPQAYVYVGLIISGIVLAILAAGLAFLPIRDWRNKRR